MSSPETTPAGFGFWCFDCRAPMLRPAYEDACLDAADAGWRIIRGVNRCPDCAADDDAMCAAEANREAWRQRELAAGRVVVTKYHHA